MLIIGELINSTRKQVKEALERKDEAIIRHLARIQVEAGSDALDINTATSTQREIEDMKWVIGLIYDEVGEVRLSIDSPNPQVIAAGLKLCQARPIINSISNEKGKSSLIKLAAETDADIIGLAMGEHRIPMTADDRLEQTQTLMEKCERVGIHLDRIYVDMICIPVGSSSEQGIEILEAVRRAKTELNVKTFAAVSNISFGLPNRRLLNRTYLSMLLGSGLDGAIIDPTDKEMMDTIYASHALLGTDKYCMKYLEHHRNKS